MVNEDLTNARLIAAIFGEQFFGVSRGQRHSVSVYGRAWRQRSEQYLTSSHTRSHFFRHVNGRPQVTQSFCGKSAFFGFFGGGGIVSLTSP